MKQLYGIDMVESQHPKLLEDIPSADIVITMGCIIESPYLPCKHREDWGEVPTGKTDAEYIGVIKAIEAKIKGLKTILSGLKISVKL